MDKCGEGKVGVPEAWTAFMRSFRAGLVSFYNSKKSKKIVVIVRSFCARVWDGLSVQDDPFRAFGRS